MDAMLRRYILIHEWVPDEDVARELFLRFAREEMLLREANRWRARHGMPPVEPVPVNAPLRRLHPREEEDARRLARRAIIRGRWLVTSAALTAALLSLTAMSAIRSQSQRTQTPETAPVQAPAPVIDPAVLEQRHPDVTTLYGDSVATMYRFQVHRAEATEGSVRIWWSVQGPFADREVPALPVLAGGPPGRQQRFMPSAYHVSAQEEGRFTGETRYLLPGSTGQPVYVFWSPWLVNPFVFGTEAIRVEETAIRMELQPDAVDEPVLTKSVKPATLMAGGQSITVEEIQVTEDFIAVIVALPEEWKYPEVASLLTIVGKDQQRRSSYAERAGGAYRLLYFPRVPGDTQSVELTLASVQQARMWLTAEQFVEANMSLSGDLTVTLIGLPDMLFGEGEIFYFPGARNLKPSHVDRSRYPWIRYVIIGAEEMPTALFYQRLEPEKGHTMRFIMQGR